MSYNLTVTQTTLQHHRSRTPGMVNPLFSPIKLPVTLYGTPTSNGRKGYGDLFYSFSHTVEAASNNILIFASCDTQTPIGNNAVVTWNGTALTKWQDERDIGLNGRLSIWYLLQPASGTHDIYIEDTEYGWTAYGAFTFKNVNQSNPLSSWSMEGGGTPATYHIDVVKTTTNSAIVGINKFWGTWPSETKGAISLFQGNSDDSHRGFGSYIPAATAYTSGDMEWYFGEPANGCCFAGFSVDPA